MKQLILSDIHSNWEALSVFQQATERDIHAGAKVICLGDTVGYGPDPVFCLRWVREYAEHVISGNHERMLFSIDLQGRSSPLAVDAIRWTFQALSSRDLDYIDNLPPFLSLPSCCYLAHGSPVDPDAYILRPRQVESALEWMRENRKKLCFFGHTHYQGMFDSKGQFHYQFDKPIPLDPEEIYLINPGSLGQPRDGNPNAAYCEYDPDRHEVTFRRLEYPVSVTAGKIEERGLPEELAERLYYGR